MLIFIKQYLVPNTCHCWLSWQKFDMEAFLSPLVTADWLKANINDPDVVILDATIKKVTDSNDTEESNMGIPAARFFDIKKGFSDRQSKLPNMLPNPADFTRAAQQLGIKKTSKIVVYDKLGIYSSPRVWWMFRTMGHEQVAVLDGGLPEWIRAGGSIIAMAPQFTETGNFQANFLSDWVTDATEVLKNIESKTCKVLDARSAGRFRGTAPEPRAGLRGGHIPGSFSLPYTEVLIDGKFKSIAELKMIFEEKNSERKRMIFSCGSGITASIILLAAHLAGQTKGAVYDGSWTEWGDDERYPVEKH